MATKILSGTYSAGYSLAAGFDVLTVTATGSVHGGNGAIGFPGQAGGVGLTVAHAASTHNLGYIMGGDGGRGYGSGDYGGIGGAGLSLSAGGYLINQSTISGGGGGGGGPGDAYGYNGGGGARGGVGVDVSAGGHIVNSQLIGGGAGGVGGVGFMGLSGAGGAGGIAVALSGGGTLSNNGHIHGGAGATGGHNDVYSGGAGGAGGVAVSLTVGETLYNNQIIGGGTGGAGGAGSNGGGGGGAGGAGVLLSAVASVSNGYYITGGLGGAGGASGGGYPGGLGGAGGAGIVLAAGGAVTNYGTLFGGTGGAGGSGNGAGGAGGAGVALLADGTLYNSATIQGGAGGANGGAGTAAAGGGVTLSAGGTVINGLGDAPYALIRGGIGVYSGPGGAASVDNLATIVGTGGVGVELAAGGSVINGFSAARYSAVISGKIGVIGGAGGATTVVANYGIIDGTGGTGVEFLNAADRLVVDAGAGFVGKAVGGGGTLELHQGSGTLSHLGRAGTLTGAVALAFTGFGTYQLDAGTWTLAGPGTLAAGKTLANAGSLTVTGTVIDDGKLTNGAGDAVTLANAALLEVQGALVNGGGITLASTTSSTQVRVLAAGMTLSGGGTVTLAGPKSRISGAVATATLTNLDNTISGSGWVGLGKMTLVNQAKGVIEAVGKLIVNTKGESVLNAGLLESAAASTLKLVSTTIDQSAGGTIAALAGGRVLLADDVIIGGTLSQAGNGLFNVNLSGGELDGSTHTVTLAGALRVLSGVSLTLDGTIRDTGKLETFGGAKASKLVIGPHGVMLTGAGQVMFNANVNNIIVGQAPGDTLTNVDNRIAGAGNIGDGAMMLVNRAAGQIIGNSAATLILDTGANKITNAGLIESAGTGQVLVKSAVVNSGTLYARNGTLALEGAVTGAGLAEIRSGVLDLRGAFGEAVTFLAGATGQLRLDDWIAFTGTVAGLSKTGANSLDLGLFTLPGAHASYNGTTAAGVLTVANGTQTAHIKLTGNYIGATWILTSDGHGGTKVVDPALLSQAAAAFAAPSAAHVAPPALGPPPQNTLIHG
ncbi:MAG TPA: hypothetical protein VG166_08145 [Caulobacteraceae bacterium]|jgi:hypothetical protein|nr:hypothetical protein [Caulobacteraceae bacterium]